MIHDLVIGDMGRRGTLRYLELFSRAERRLLGGPGARDFFDEQRQVAVTTVCAGRWLKSLPDSFSALRCLAGTYPGRDVMELADVFLSLIARYLPALLLTRPTGIRIIVPCNTLDPLVRWLASDVFSNAATFERALVEYAAPADVDALLALVMENKIVVPAIVGTVTQRMLNDDPREVFIAGTPVAVRAYCEAIARRRPEVVTREWLPSPWTSFTELLVDTLSCDRVSAHPPVAKQQRVYLCGCTDLELPGCVDALGLFAEAMAELAYSAGKEARA
ncbi:MAG: hypothetical protein IPJ24_04000 [bacterium]|nr:hypothetical protein [bacterium]